MVEFRGWTDIEEIPSGVPFEDNDDGIYVWDSDRQLREVTKVPVQWEYKLGQPLYQDVDKECPEQFFYDKNRAQDSDSYKFSDVDIYGPFRQSETSL
ncbi:hypothetical protein SEA_ZIKO_117 [Gordonia phage Ziko]|uniref:Uncharacterized protein n=1 Tax=Gordonia phage Ziko TaxID=2591193 RepID=A0A514A5A4_9CAUD|nr:hypothetical protein SEA_ZIKO_117 [Gordonia phage Ziko]